MRDFASSQTRQGPSIKIIEYERALSNYNGRD